MKQTEESRNYQITDLLLEWGICRFDIYLQLLEQICSVNVTISLNRISMDLMG